MRIAVLGAAGQLGRDLCPRLAALGEVVPLSRADIDLAQLDTIRSKVDALRPDVFVNCAAYNFVDKAEADWDGAYRANASGPRQLAIACALAGAKLVHFGTDYVFGADANRDTPYTEDDQTGPASAYGESKANGEALIRFS